MVAATGQPVRADEWPQIDVEALRGHVAYLADDRLEGRAPGTPGYDLAAGYVVEQLRSAGLQPAGPDDQWLQPVSVLESTSDVAAARATLKLGRVEIDLQSGVDFLPAPAFQRTSVGADAPLVFVGWGISAPEFRHDDLAGIDLAGKIAVLLPGAPPSIPPELRDYFGKLKLAELAARGAVGHVVLTAPDADSRKRWAGATQRTDAAAARLLDPAGRPVDAPEGMDASATLGPRATAQLIQASSLSPAAFWTGVGNGEAPRVDLDARLRLETRSRHRIIRSVNVVGRLQGSHPRLRDEHVVMMAHLDHFGRRLAVDGDDIYNGALDNAGGVAILIEAARMLADAPRRPRRSILVVALASEERGLHGSRHFALHPTVPADSLVAAVNVDMPVALYPAAGYVAFGADHSTLGDVARQALEAEGLQMLADRRPDRGLFTYTDQFSFVRVGVPALYLHDAPLSADPGIDAQAIFDDFLARHYHRPSDDVDLPIDWQSLARLAKVYARICDQIAAADEPPSWNPDSFFGRRHGSSRNHAAR